MWGAHIFFLILLAVIYSLVGFVAGMATFGPQGHMGDNVWTFYACMGKCSGPESKWQAKADARRVMLSPEEIEFDNLENLPKGLHQSFYTLSGAASALHQFNNEEAGAPKKSKATMASVQENVILDDGAQRGSLMKL